MQSGSPRETPPAWASVWAYAPRRGVPLGGDSGGAGPVDHGGQGRQAVQPRHLKQEVVVGGNRGKAALSRSIDCACQARASDCPSSPNSGSGKGAASSIQAILSPQQPPGNEPLPALLATDRLASGEAEGAEDRAEAAHDREAAVFER